MTYKGLPCRVHGYRAIGTNRFQLVVETSKGLNGVHLCHMIAASKYPGTLDVVKKHLKNLSANEDDFDILQSPPEGIAITPPKWGSGSFPQMMAWSSSGAVRFRTTIAKHSGAKAALDYFRTHMGSKFPEKYSLEKQLDPHAALQNGGIASDSYHGAELVSQRPLSKAAKQSVISLNEADFETLLTQLIGRLSTNGGLSSTAGPALGDRLARPVPVVAPV